jgi:hypothetical protein
MECFHILHWFTRDIGLVSLLVAQAVLADLTSLVLLCDPLVHLMMYCLHGNAQQAIDSLPCKTAAQVERL